MLILSVALESQAGHCHRGFVVSSWRLAFPGSSQAPPAPSCCPRSSSKSSQTPQGLPRLFPLRPFPHQQETKLWPSFRYSSLRRQNSNLPPPRSLGWLRGRTQRRTFTDTMCSLTKVAREWVPGGAPAIPGSAPGSALPKTQQKAAFKAQMMCLSLHPDAKKWWNCYFLLENEAEPQLQQHNDRQLQHSLVPIVLSVVSDTVYFNHALLLGNGLMTLLIGSYRRIENDPVSNRFWTQFSHITSLRVGVSLYY